MRCLIASCINDMHLRMEDGGTSTHRVPMNPERNARWMRILSSTDCYMSQNARICSRHFYESDFVLVKGKRKLKKDAVPSLYLTESDENNFRLMTCIEFPTDIESNADNRIPLRNISNGPLKRASVGKTCNSTLSSRFWSTDKVDPVDFQVQSGSDQSVITLAQQAPFPEIQLGSKSALAVPKDSQKNHTAQPKRIRYAGDVKDVVSLTPQQAMQAIPVFRNQLLRSQKRVNQLKHQNLHLRRKVKSFSNIMAELKKRNMINDQGELVLQVTLYKNVICNRIT